MEGTFLNDYGIYFLGAILLLALITFVVLLVRTSQIRELGQQIERNWKKLDSLQEKQASNERTIDQIQDKAVLIEAAIIAMKNDADDNRDLVIDNVRAQQSQMTEIETQRMEQLDRRMEGLEKRLGEINRTTEERLTKLQQSNEEKLNQMRETVDEKLQKTLEDRLSQSFKQVSDQLEQVYRGLGEMQNLAAGVGDLKKVLSNVKTRGILGEIQLGAILEQILPRERYAENVATKKNSADRVEFAVCLPGEDEKRPVYLPIDAKFPLDLYADLREAVDSGNLPGAAAARKALQTRIRNEAKDIHDKYIDPPYTTDFGLMFLPVEGLYAEVVQDGLVEVLQRDYKVNIAGPSTMAAMLNALQMGFKTLAIQKHTNQVWDVLGSVQKEFDKFGEVLVSTQKRLRQADEDLELLVGTRTRKIQSTLKKVTKLESPALIRPDDRFSIEDADDFREEDE